MLFRSGVPIINALTSAYVPHLAVGGGWISTLSLLNTDDTSQSVRVTAVFSDSQGNTSVRTVDRNLSPRMRSEEDIGFMFGLQSAPNLLSGYLKVDVLAGFGIFSNVEYGTFDGRLLSAVPAQGTPSADFYFSHIAEGLGYYTGIALLNPNPERVPVAIDIYARDGSRVTGRVLNLKIGRAHV